MRDRFIACPKRRRENLPELVVDEVDPSEEALDDDVEDDVALVVEDDDVLFAASAVAGSLVIAAAPWTPSAWRVGPNQERRLCKLRSSNLNAPNHSCTRQHSTINDIVRRTLSGLSSSAGSVARQNLRQARYTTTPTTRHIATTRRATRRMSTAAPRPVVRAAGVSDALPVYTSHKHSCRKITEKADEATVQHVSADEQGERKRGGGAQHVHRGLQCCRSDQRDERQNHQLAQRTPQCQASLGCCERGDGSGGKLVSRQTEEWCAG